MTVSLFTELDAYKACRGLKKHISELVKVSFPVEEKYRLSDQLIRSSRSATATIAEGYGRFHFKENVQFCRIARGSLMETLDHLITAFDENYISLEILLEFKMEIDHCLKLLNGYIRYLQRQ